MLKKSILLIDDDEDLCQEMAGLLRSEGYSVRGTSNPIQAEKYINKYNFDIAIFDHKMPGLTGIDMVRMIYKKNSSTKVLFITGKPFFEQLLKKEDVSHMVSGVIPKPFSEKELLDRIGNSNNKE